MPQFCMGSYVQQSSCHTVQTHTSTPACIHSQGQKVCLPSPSTTAPSLPSETPELVVCPRILRAPNVCFFQSVAVLCHKLVRVVQWAATPVRLAGRLLVCASEIFKITVRALHLFP